MLQKRKTPGPVTLRHWAAELLTLHVSLTIRAGDIPTATVPVWMTDRELARAFKVKPRLMRAALEELSWKPWNEEALGSILYAAVGDMTLRRFPNRRLYSAALRQVRRGDGRRPPDTRPPRGPR
ncbi:MAG: hypothetical protein ABIJ75_07145 [Actinomycetota bacterium]